MWVTEGGRGGDDEGMERGMKRGEGSGREWLGRGMRGKEGQASVMRLKLLWGDDDGVGGERLSAWRLSKGLEVRSPGEEGEAGR